jgi:hypothetical protein
MIEGVKYRNAKSVRVIANFWIVSYQTDGSAMIGSVSLKKDQI